MKPHEIRYFLALCENLNFTRAAEESNVTQPALTRAIQHLEAKLGAPLFIRERGKTSLTEFGQTMMPYLRGILEKEEEAKRRAHAFLGLEDARLRVGLMCTICPVALTDLFYSFVSHHRGVDVSLTDGNARDIEERLLSGEADVAIYCAPETPNERIEFADLFAERFVVAIAPTHPLAQLSRVCLRDLDGHRYLWRTHCEYADQIDSAFEEAGISVEYPYDSECDGWIQAMVLASLGFTLMPEFTVTLTGLETRPLIEPSFERRIGIGVIKGRPFPPTIQAFVEHVHSYPWQEKMRAPSVPGNADALMHTHLPGAKSDPGDA